MSITRHHLKQENRMMLWALCFAAKNRISFRHLDNLDDTCSIRDIGLQVSLSTCSIYTVHKYFACVEIIHNFYKFQNYLPSERDWIQLRGRMINIVQGIVQKYFPQFNEMNVKSNIHQYTEQSEKKSEIVSSYLIDFS